MFFVIATSRTLEGWDIAPETASAHESYLARHSARILAAGSTVRGDGTLIGSVFIIEADSLLDVAHFVEEDPITASGGQAVIDIVEWRMAGFDRIYPLPASAETLETH